MEKTKMCESTMLLWDTIMSDHRDSRNQKRISTKQYKCLMKGIKKRYYYHYSKVFDEYFVRALFGDNISYENLPGWKAHTVVGWFIGSNYERLSRLDEIAEEVASIMKDRNIDVYSLDGRNLSGSRQDGIDWDDVERDYDISKMKW